MRKVGRTFQLEASSRSGQRSTQPLEWLPCLASPGMLVEVVLRWRENIELSADDVGPEVSWLATKAGIATA